MKTVRPDMISRYGTDNGSSEAILSKASLVEEIGGRGVMRRKRRCADDVCEETKKRLRRGWRTDSDEVINNGLVEEPSSQWLRRA
jgi:hypothetical protein